MPKPRRAGVGAGFWDYLSIKKRLSNGELGYIPAYMVQYVTNIEYTR